MLFLVKLSEKCDNLGKRLGKKYNDNSTTFIMWNGYMAVEDRINDTDQ